MNADIRRAVEHRLPQLLDLAYDTAQTPVWRSYAFRKILNADEHCPLFDVPEGASDTVGQYETLRRVALDRGYRVTSVPEETPDCTGHTDALEHFINISPDFPSVIRANTFAHELGHTALHKFTKPTTFREYLEILEARNASMVADEIEAETTAWLVSQSLGTDATFFSVAYLLEYGGGFRGAAKVLRDPYHRERILDAAAEILSSVRVEALVS